MTWNGREKSDAQLPLDRSSAAGRIVRATVNGLEWSGNREKPQAEGTHEGSTRTLSGGNSVHARELIRTGDAGVADLRFHDNSNLSVSPKSSVRLDKFVYDPNCQRRSLVELLARRDKPKL